MKKWIALLAALLLIPAAMAEHEPALLQVHQMMIGCADGYLIRYGDVDILIDGGNAVPQKPTDDVVNYLRAAGVDTLDACIITHWHLDHCMNMNAVLAEFGDADTVVYGPSDAEPEKIFNGTVTVEIGPVVQGEYRQMKMGDVLTFGAQEADAGFSIHCIGPAKLTQNGGCNPDSLNFVLSYGTRRMLFTGDYAASKCITGEYRELCANVDVFKFPHHGIAPYEVGAAAARVIRPQVLLVPGVVNEYKIWDFFDDMAVKFPRQSIYSNADGHTVILTDGGDYLEVLVNQNPADYAPQAN